MKVSAIMRTNGIKIYEHNTLPEIIKLITLSHDKTFPVLNRDQEVTGIITAKILINLFVPAYFTLLENFNFVDDFGPLEDLFIKQIQESAAISAVVAKDIMKTSVFRINHNASLLKASSMMSVNNIEFLPIVDDTMKYVGYLLEKDLLKFLLCELKN